MFGAAVSGAKAAWMADLKVLHGKIGESA